MDIAGLSMSLNQINTQNDIGILMLSKSLDLNKELGDGMVDLINKSNLELSINPNIGSNIDVLV